MYKYIKKKKKHMQREKERVIAPRSPDHLKPGVPRVNPNLGLTLTSSWG